MRDNIKKVLRVTRPVRQLLVRAHKKLEAAFLADTAFLLVHLFVWSVEKLAVAAVRGARLSLASANQRTARRLHRKLSGRYHWYAHWFERKYSRHVNVITSKDKAPFLWPR